MQTGGLAIYMMADLSSQNCIVSLHMAHCDVIKIAMAILKVCTHALCNFIVKGEPCVTSLSE